MKISIIGAGAIGSALATAMTRAGLDVAIANKRGPESLGALVQELGPRLTAVSVEEAAKADLVVLAINWSKIPEAVSKLGPWNGRIVVDANNPIEQPLFRPVDLKGRASSDVVADYVSGAHVVKAFNHLQPSLLTADPKAEGGQRVLFISGNHSESKTIVANLISRLGFAPVDLGTSDGGGRLAQFPGGPLPTLNLVKFG